MKTVFEKNTLEGYTISRTQVKAIVAMFGVEPGRVRGVRIDPEYVEIDVFPGSAQEDRQTYNTLRLMIT